MGNLKICGFKDKVPEDAVVLNTTSRSKDWARQFSPFLCQGPIELYGLTAHNVENFFQFGKVYEEHLDKPQEWLRWRAAGFADKKPWRYPMSKGRKPLFAYVNKELGRLGYIDGRKLVYLPAYLQKLDRYCQEPIGRLMKMAEEQDVWLWDFDGYDSDEPFETLLNNEKKNLGHAFLVRQYCYDLMRGTDELLRYRVEKVV